RTGRMSFTVDAVPTSTRLGPGMGPAMGPEVDPRGRGALGPPSRSSSTGTGARPAAHSATRSVPPRSTPNDPDPQWAQRPTAPHTRQPGLPLSITIGPRHEAHAAGCPQDRHTRATPYPRRDTMSAA